MGIPEIDCLASRQKCLKYTRLKWLYRLNRFFYNLVKKIKSALNGVIFQFHLVEVDLRYPPGDWLALSLAEFRMAESAEKNFKTREILKWSLYNSAADRESPF